MALFSREKVLNLSGRRPTTESGVDEFAVEGSDVFLAAGGFLSMETCSKQTNHGKPIQNHPMKQKGLQFYPETMGNSVSNTIYRVRMKPWVP